MHHLFAGLDVSTQSCKLVVIDTDRKQIVYQTSVKYDRDLPHYQTVNGVCTGLGDGVSESEPVMWLEAVELTLSRLQKSSLPQNHIRAISVSGQQHGLVALDARGKLTRKRAKLWNDFSTGKECAFLTDAIGGNGEVIREIANIQRTGYTAGKILHFKNNEPQAYQRSATLFLVHNYINWHLTGGGVKGVRVMEPGDTSGTALWDPRRKEWSERLLDAIDSGLTEKLPEVRPSTQTIGKIGGKLAEKYGLDKRCLIDAGCGDNMYAAVGTGNVVPGIVTLSLGTSGTACTFMREPFVDVDGEIACYCDSTGHYLPLLCVSNFANGYNEILRLYRWSHSDFSEVLRRTKPANEGCMIMPWFDGERTPDLPLGTPVHFGFGIGDWTRDRLCRGVMEGSVLNLQHGFQKLGMKPHEIRLTGGLSASDDWCQTIADLFEAEAVPVAGEGAALGAALHAAWVWESGRKSVPIQDIIEPFVQLEETRRRIPRDQYRHVYRLQKALFNACSKRIRGMKADDPFELRRRLRQVVLSPKIARRQSKERKK